MPRKRARAGDSVGEAVIEEFEKMMITILVILGIVGGIFLALTPDEVREHYRIKHEGRIE